MVACLLAWPSAAESKAGRCKKIPQVKGEVFRYGESLSVPEVKWTVETEELTGMDFDGTGAKVFRAPRLKYLDGRKDVSSLSWDLYILRGKCAVHLGSYSGHATPHLEQTKTNGYFDFTVMRANPYADALDRRHHDGLLLYTRYTFNGVRYVGGRPRRR